MLLHHLCYASGNTEPGLAEGTQAASIARVDNYAAGFIRAGARAVVAEAHLGPAYYVRALLRSQASIEQIWRASPDNHGNTFSSRAGARPAFPSASIPTARSGGFYRSLCRRACPRPRCAPARPAPPGGTDTGPEPVTPSLVGAGLASAR